MRRAQAGRSRGAAPNPKPPNGRLLTAEDLAERWQVPTSHVYRLTRAGALPVVRLGRYYRYREVDVEQFEAGGGSAGDA